jgi:hypothetical protein
MYFLNTTTRYSNCNATNQALEILQNTSNGHGSTIISLVKARFYEQIYHYTIPESLGCLDAYTNCSVMKRVHGRFKNKEDVPEEYRDKLMTYFPTQLSYWTITNLLNMYHLNTSSIVEKNCKPGDTAKYKSGTLECGLYINYQIETKTNWDLVLEDILNGKLDLSSSPITTPNSYYNQFSNERFHPPPSIHDIITLERKADLAKLCVLLGLELPKYWDILNLNTLITNIENKLFLQNPIYKQDVKRKHNNSVDKKHTFKAEYQVRASDEQRLGLAKTLSNAKTYKYFVKLIGLLKGRLHNMLLPAVSASALIIDKTGLAMFGEPSKDPVTQALVVLLMGSMSYQKLFTIESQMHGGLDRWLKAYLDLVIRDYGTSADFASIFRIIPSPRLVKLVPKPELEYMYNYVVEWLKLFASVFETQWELGVGTCVSRNMKVPRSGTTEINVNAWNACAGAWGNLTRYIRLIGQELDKPHMQIFKVLKMTAGDQMQWAESAGKSTDPDCEVFKDLTLGLGTKPWAGLFAQTDNWVSDIEQICGKHKVEAKKWLGGPVERSAETRPDVISVCGVVVEPQIVSLVKEAGAFGSNPFGSEH